MWGHFVKFMFLVGTIRIRVSLKFYLPLLWLVVIPIGRESYRLRYKRGQASVDFSFEMLPSLFHSKKLGSRRSNNYETTRVNTILERREKRRNETPWGWRAVLWIVRNIYFDRDKSPTNQPRNLDVCISTGIFRSKNYA